MKLILASLLLASTSIVSASAADFSVVSKVDAVTVFPQGADVTRVADVDVPPGEHRILLSDLPGSIDPRSLRVEGAGQGTLEISSVDTRVIYVAAADQDARRKVLEKEIAALIDERTGLDQKISDANHQRTFLLGLADKQLVPQTSTETIKGIDVTQLTGLLDLVGTRLGGLAKVMQDAQLRQRDIDEKVAELQNSIAVLAPAQGSKVEAAINVVAAGAMKGSLRVSYRLQEAGWAPYYDARLVTPEAGGVAKLDIVRRAEVTQSSSEMWDNVELTLSTTRPVGETAAPELAEEELYAQNEADKRARLSMTKRKQESATPAPEADAMIAETMNDTETGFVAAEPAPAKPVMQSQATLQLAGFQANYVIGGRVSIDNSGTAKKVRISSAAQDATLEAVAVPRLDGNAYLTAAFKLAGDGPMLPGTVNLYRDAVYVGQGQVPLLNSGEEAKLGFGVDDQIKVERKEVKKSTGEEGLLTSSSVEERAWDITVKNLHSFAMNVRVVDRMPFTANTQVEVSVLPGMTAPTEDNVKKQRGVKAWVLAVEPGAEAVVKTGYRISWPEGMDVGMVE